MVPARNLLRRHYDTYGAWFSDTHNNNNNKPSVVRSDPMAEDHSRTNGNQDEEEEEEEAGTSSKDDWLQLAIGCSSATTQVTSSRAEEGRVELELFSNRPSSISSPPPLPPPPPPLPGGSTMMGAIPPAMPVFPPHGLTYRRETPWGFWNPNPMLASASSTPPPPPLQYSFRRFAYPPASSGVPVDVRVVTPPRRPQAGVWFVLQAAQNQVREPFLPQIPKSYSRIKDGRMTVRLLMKYLVNKLGLDDESEVEITCRGQPLLPFLTLQHVRDNIWSLRAAMELLPDSPANHVMTLQYGRSRT